VTGEIAANLDEIRQRVARAATDSGRAASAVTLVVVTKTVPEGRVREALEAGARDLGENRAQELVAKAAALADIAPPLRWHFIGRLQRNKVKQLAGNVDLWHSVDRPELADPFSRHAPRARVLVEVNLSGEAQKGGCRPEDSAALVDHLRGAGLVVEGLMTVPAAVGDPRGTFAALREIAARLGLAGLSMGMTADFEAAIAEGATIVRVGSAVFGPRSGTEGLRR
jgi:pyridoxal phosphate enzyme (YggS family)